MSCLRLTNCHGPGQRVRDGEKSFLGFWIGAILRGNRSRCGAARQERDFCHVDDVVAALLCAAEAPGCHGQALNAGGHSSLTVLALAEYLRAEAGAAFTVRAMPAEQAAIDMGSFVGGR